MTRTESRFANFKFTRNEILFDRSLWSSYNHLPSFAHAARLPQRESLNFRQFPCYDLREISRGESSTIATRHLQHHFSNFSPDSPGLPLDHHKQRVGRASVPTGDMSSSSLLDAYSPNSKVWFPDKEKGWISGHVATRTIDGDQVKFGFVDDNGKVSLQFKGKGGIPGERAALGQDGQTGSSTSHPTI